MQNKRRRTTGTIDHLQLLVQKKKLLNLKPIKLHCNMHGHKAQFQKIRTT